MLRCLYQVFSLSLSVTLCVQNFIYFIAFFPYEKRTLLRLVFVGASFAALAYIHAFNSFIHSFVCESSNLQKMKKQQNKKKINETK